MAHELTLLNLYMFILLQKVYDVMSVDGLISLNLLTYYHMTFL